MIWECPGRDEEIRSADFLLTDHILTPPRAAAVVPHDQSEDPGSSCRKCQLSLLTLPVSGVNTSVKWQTPGIYATLPGQLPHF